MHVAILLYEGFDELDAIGPYEVLSTAADFGADLAVDLRTLDPAERVTASHGLRVEPDGVLDERDNDLVLVPGGGWNDRSEAGAWAEAERGDLPDRLAALHADGVAIASVCTGGMLLAAAGLLDGRPAVTHGSAVDDLRERGVEVVDARVVDDVSASAASGGSSDEQSESGGGDVLTAGGVTSGLDLALWLVEREAGASVADAVATELEYERRDDVYVGGDGT